MVEQAAASTRDYSSVFNSSVPQRPLEGAASRSYGGRPLGPNSYNPPQPPWIVEIERGTSAFLSKTEKSKLAVPITAELDFLDKPEQFEMVNPIAPGSKGLKWNEGEPKTIYDFYDQPLDRFYDPDYGVKQTLQKGMVECPRKYAATFNSVDPRFKKPKEISALGPGSYEQPPSAVQIKEPKRMTYSFKSTTSTSSFKTKSDEAVDSVSSGEAASQAKHWTSKGFAFSTRERFPRQRARWKD